MRRHPRFVLIGLFGLASSWARGQTLVYFGTCTGAKSQGIYVSSLDTSGRLTEPELAAENQGSDSVAVFRIDPGNGRLTPAGRTIDVASPVAIAFVTY